METVTTILSVPAVLALVELGKRLGVRGQWALLLAVVIAVVLNVAAHFWGATELFGAVAAGLLTGLADAGLYDVAGYAGGYGEDLEDEDDVED